MGECVDVRVCEGKGLYVVWELTVNVIFHKNIFFEIYKYFFACVSRIALEKWKV